MGMAIFSPVVSASLGSLGSFASAGSFGNDPAAPRPSWLSRFRRRRRRDDDDAQPQRVAVRRASAGLDRDLRRVRALADLLDTRFSLLGIRFGLDTIAGLIPVVGDTAAALVGAYPILVARRHRLGTLVQLRMAWNLFVEWLIGLVPLAGDVFDTVFKANVRNAALLERAAARARWGAGE
jgi:hypothetical protein